MWGGQTKVNTFNSRLKLLIPAHLCTINKVLGGGVERQLGLSSPISWVFALRQSQPPSRTTAPPNASFSFCVCHLHWFSICFPWPLHHHLFGHHRIWGFLSEGLLEWRGHSYVCFYHKWCLDLKKKNHFEVNIFFIKMCTNVIDGGGFGSVCTCVLLEVLHRKFSWFT